jgi:UDP-3-O-[3-hydroxymyristoyl] glucosamine N-acyltransferase
MMQATLAQLAALVDGSLLGDGRLVIHGAATLRDAGPGEITLVDGEERKRGLAECRAAAAVAPKTFRPEGLPVIQVDDMHQAFAAIVCCFRPQRPEKRTGVSPFAVVSPTAILADDVQVHPLATVGDEVVIGPGTTIHSGVHVMAGSQIGPHVTIFPNAVLYENTLVGPRCVIHAGAVLGAYGFGYSLVEGRHELSAQLGNVVLGADVEIGAGTTVDRGTYGPTVIGEGTKIDDLVMVAHNCRIGRHNMLCSQVGIAGSTSTGDYVVMAGQVGVRDHVHIGDRAVLGAMAGVTNDVPDGCRMIGIPATPEREQKIKLATFSKLPEMRRQLRQLQRTVDTLIEEATAGDTSTSPEEKHGPDDLPRRRAVA